MIHGKPTQDTAVTHCNIPVADLVEVLYPSPVGPEILVVYCDTPAPLAEQSLCSVCEDACAGPGAAETGAG